MLGRQGTKREVEYRVIRAQEDERKRLARDLHDGLVQTLAGVGMNLEVVERHITADPMRKPEALALLGRLRDEVSGCLEEARRILTDLRPLTLDGRSLAQALKDYAERFSAEAGLRTTIVVSGQEEPLHPSLEAGLFRIFQEALNNTREHADAREVALKLRFLPKSVAMDVSDDGRGFEWDGKVENLAARRCFGLLGIDERVRLLGGTWRISTEPGRGTEVRVRVPIERRGGFWSFAAGLSSGEAAGGPGVETQSERVRAGEGGRMPKVRVLIADDHRVVREGLKMIFDLEPGVAVVGEAATGDEAIRLARDLAPDVVVLDLVMPGPGAPETTREIRRQSPETAVIAITAHHDPGEVRELIAAGVAGYLLKSAGAEEIVGAVLASATGVRPLAAEAVSALQESREAGSREDAGGLAAAAGPTEAAELGGLTLREREVLALLGEGLTNREISRRLFISEKTVRNHLGAIVRKLGLDDRTQAALAAREMVKRARGVP